MIRILCIWLLCNHLRVANQANRVMACALYAVFVVFLAHFLFFFFFWLVNEITSMYMYIVQAYDNDKIEHLVLSCLCVRSCLFAF